MTNETVSASAQALLEQQSPENNLAELHRLRAEVQGPDGFETWKQAALDERLRRVESERKLKDLEQQYQEQAQGAVASNEQPAHKPVAWRYQNSRGHYRYRGYVKGFDVDYKILRPIPLYTAPPLRDLSDDEIKAVFRKSISEQGRQMDFVELGRALIKAAREQV